MMSPFSVLGLLNEVRKPRNPRVSGLGFSRESTIRETP